jgi:hypothetical protein
MAPFVMRMEYEFSGLEGFKFFVDLPATSAFTQ